VRVGLFGGTFDPIHLGHLIKAEEAREALSLDEVWFVPAGQPWLKTDRPVSEARHRLAMVELAVGPNPYFRISDMEVERPGPSYTLDTLLEMRRQLGPAAEIFLLLGADSLRHMERWHEPKQVLKLAKVAAFSRPRGEAGHAEDFQPEWLDRILPGAGTRAIVLEGAQIAVSGTDIRRRVAEGRSIKYRVPEQVEAYISQHKLYQPQAALAKKAGAAITRRARSV
jgi:nicotinate-nucleotide adenylyltransferase